VYSRQTPKHGSDDDTKALSPVLVYLACTNRSVDKQGWHNTTDTSYPKRYNTVPWDADESSHPKLSSNHSLSSAGHPSTTIVHHGGSVLKHNLVRRASALVPGGKAVVAFDKRSSRKLLRLARLPAASWATRPKSSHVRAPSPTGSSPTWAAWPFRLRRRSRDRPARLLTPTGQPRCRLRLVRACSADIPCGTPSRAEPPSPRLSTARRLREPAGWGETPGPRWRPDSNKSAR
jgi:hypothetical protein